MKDTVVAFRALHHGPRILTLPNAWDGASARLIEAAGFPALGTTSAGIASLLGRPDGERVERDEMLAVIRRIVEAVDIMVTADVEAGYGPRPEDVARTVRGVLDAGAVGINLEDGTGRPEAPLRDLPEAVERIRAAREAAVAAGRDLFINARTDGFWTGGSGPETAADTVRRANAYLAAGADGVFVPFVRDAPTIARLVREIDGPLNVLATPDAPPIPELEALGVARVSVGSLIARSAYGLVRDALRELREEGTLRFAAGAVSYPEMNRLLERRPSPGD
jgi:2-methylisocitrate lyase-like PEP mutase family enzyme